MSQMGLKYFNQIVKKSFTHLKARKKQANLRQPFNTDYMIWEQLRNTIFRGLKKTNQKKSSLSQVIRKTNFKATNLKTNLKLLLTYQYKLVFPTINNSGRRISHKIAEFLGN